MSVDGVNNSNNAGLYAASGAVLGAGAGAAAGYLTKPFLKDGAPTDSFCKTLGQNVCEAFTEENKNLLKKWSPIISKLENLDIDRLTAEELKAHGLEIVSSVTSDCKTVPEFLNAVKGENDLGVSFFNEKADAEILEKLGKANNIEEAKGIVSTALQDAISSNSDSYKAGLKSIQEAGVSLSPKAIGKQVWEEAYDSANKKFIKDGVTEEAMSAIKKTMHSFQGKAAMMYGAIGAAVLGVAGYLCGGIGADKETSETPQKVDAQA